MNLQAGGLAVTLLLLMGCGTSSLPEGSFREAQIIGSRGRQPGQFSKPRAVAIALTGEIVIIDRTGRVQILDGETGSFIRQWWLSDYVLGTPTGISIDPTDNTIWIADTHYNRVLNVTLKGKLLRSFGEEGAGPGKFRFITDVAPDPDGETLWITDFGTRNRVIHYTRDGEFLREWGPEPFQNNHDLERPMSVVVSEDGQRLFVVDTGNGRVNIYDREGNTIGAIGRLGNAPGELRYPQDIALAPDGTLYVVEYGNSRLSRFSQTGEFLGYWGRVGRSAGELYAPWGVAVGVDGRLVIADTSNDRLQILRDPLTFLVRPNNSDRE